MTKLLIAGMLAVSTFAYAGNGSSICNSGNSKTPAKTPAKSAVQKPAAVARPAASCAPTCKPGTGACRPAMCKGASLATTTPSWLLAGGALTSK